jgi:hypothetical protein
MPMRAKVRDQITGSDDCSNRLTESAVNPSSPGLLWVHARTKAAAVARPCAPNCRGNSRSRSVRASSDARRQPAPAMTPASLRATCINPTLGMGHGPALLRAACVVPTLPRGHEPWRHPRVGGDPVRFAWIPSFAGMTRRLFRASRHPVAHGKPSETIQMYSRKSLYCFVAAFLAMTPRGTITRRKLIYSSCASLTRSAGNDF